MARHVMKMTDIGEGVVDAEVVAWLVGSGDAVAEDQHIVDVMTDKATVEMSSPVAGTVIELCVEPGSRVAVGAPLIIFETGLAAHTRPADEPRPKRPEVSVTAVQPPLVPVTPHQAAAPPPAAPVTSLQPTAESRSVYKPLAVPTVQAAAPPPAAPVVSLQPAAAHSIYKPLAAPTVRRRAREAHVDLAEVPASGRGGRITHEDLDRYIVEGRHTSAAVVVPSPVTQAAPPAGRDGSRAIRVIGLRRVIAERMALSKRRIPHYSYVEEVDVTDLQALLDHLNTRRREEQPKLSYLPVIMKALTKALANFPQCNSHFDDEAGVVTQFDAVHMGVAAHTPNGLMVPVVRHVETLDFWQIATEILRLSSAARAGKCTREELSGSTITVTSLGKLGGLASTPVINHPEVTILGVNKAIERPMIRNGVVVARLMMNLSASFDHRIVDGFDGASLVQAVKDLLEFPATIFI